MQTQPVEDIDAVLGRFQAWAGSRNATETKPGVRELSYEEALQSSRYRWKAASSNPAATDAASEPEPARDKANPAKVRSTKRKTEKTVRAENDSEKAAKRKTLAAPEFKDALAKQVRPSDVVVVSKPVELTRQASISIRLAPAERALIKARAAEAGISASAYMRQCALEVEQLRAQVQQAIAAIERKVPASISAPTSASGFFARLAQRLC
jgi:hypothetical protein